MNSLATTLISICSATLAIAGHIKHDSTLAIIMAIIAVVVPFITIKPKEDK